MFKGINRFSWTGFTILRSFLSPVEVKEYRQLFDEMTKHLSSKKRMLDPSEVLACQKIYSLSFRPALVQALKQILGTNYAMFSDFQVQKNKYGGWHVDSNSEGNQAYLQNSKYRFIKVGVYFQDNTDEYGGGIDVVPGGHKFPLITQDVKRNFKIKQRYNEYGQKWIGKPAKLHAGDLLIFDSRLPHKATWPRLMRSNGKDGQPQWAPENVYLSQIPSEHTKYVFYFDACHPDFVETFLQNSIQRSEQENLNGQELFFNDYLGSVFPEDYPEDFVKQAQEQGIQVVSLSQAKAQKYKERRRFVHDNRTKQAS